MPKRRKRHPKEKPKSQHAQKRALGRKTKVRAHVWSPARVKTSKQLAKDAAKALSQFGKDRLILPAKWEGRAREALREYIRATYTPMKETPGEPLTEAEITSIMRRTTVGTVLVRARRQDDAPGGILEKYNRHVAEGGVVTWTRKRDGKPMLRRHIDRAKGMLAYWRAIRVLRESTGWGTHDCRAAWAALKDHPFMAEPVGAERQSPKIIPRAAAPRRAKSTGASSYGKATGAES